MQSIAISGVQYACLYACLLPKLTTDEFNGLREDIRRNGILHPVIVTKRDEQFVLIDGHHRAAIALELDLHVPVSMVEYSSEAAMREHALALNLHRRHLTREQKRQFIAGQLKSSPGHSDRSIAERAKVDHKTVAATRAKLEATGEIPQCEATTGKDGITRPVRKRPLTTTSSGERTDRSVQPGPLSDGMTRSAELRQPDTAHPDTPPEAPVAPGHAGNDPPSSLVVPVLQARLATSPTQPAGTKGVDLHMWWARYRDIRAVYQAEVEKAQKDQWKRGMLRKRAKTDYLAELDMWAMCFHQECEEAGLAEPEMTPHAPVGG